MSWATTHLLACGTHLRGTEHAETVERLRRVLLALHEKLAEENEDG